MTKCDFCTMSDPRGKCFWSNRVAAENNCRKAIERMVEALSREKKKKRGWF